nr:efflux RND transporter periplasmic adaptor subunit [Luteimonas sp. JM171]AOH36982.1 efflux transporter periplasmic adaptor subunit [Luteimonas sp. JM171]
MNSSRWLLGAAVVLAAIAAGWWGGRHFQPEVPAQQATTDADEPRRILYYRNPMGLPDTSPVPKKDSMGMDYIPVYEGGEAPAAAGTVVLPPEKVQKLGVRTEAARLAPLSTIVRASATVRVDETRQHVIAPKFEGWVERLHANQTGMMLRRGEPLLTVYSPELLAARNEYRVADAAARTLAAGDPASADTMARLRDAAQQRLRNWDISGPQLTNAGGNSGTLVIHSPANGVVVEKPIVEGDRFAAGDTILRLADLSTVWLIAEVPSASAGRVSIGQHARFESPTLPGRTFEGQVGFIQPIVDPRTRTLAVRIELPNPDGDLRPGLFGDVVLSRDSVQEALTVPRSAVLDSGLRQVVLVQVAEGRFEPRTVQLGQRSGERVEVLEGLHDGERVVVSANFLIDAESNLQSALDALAPSPDAPDEHGEHDTHEAGHDHGGHAEMPAHGPTPTPTSDPDEAHEHHDSHDSHETHQIHEDHEGHGAHENHGTHENHENHDAHVMEH